MKPLLVLGPSLGTVASTLWGPCIERLSDDFEIAAWDLPGHGVHRDEPVPSDLTVEDLARWVLDRVDEPFHYAGDSVGGAVGLQLALDAPDRVQSLVVLCSGARIGTQQSWADRIAQVRAGGTAAVVEGSATRWFGDGFMEREPDLSSRLLLELVDRVSDAGYIAVCEALAGFDVRDRLSEIAAPTLAVAGEQDAVTPVEGLQLVADRVRTGRRLAVLPGVAHLAPTEAPFEVAGMIHDWCLDRGRVP